MTPVRRAAAVVLTAVLAASCAPRATNVQTLVIAAVLPLSGEFAPLGRAVREGIELALGPSTEDGSRTSRPVRAVLVAKDDRGDPAAAAAAVRRLEGDIPVVIAGVLPEEAIAAARAAEETGRILLVPSVTDPRVTAQSRWVFRAAFDDRAAGAAMAVYASRVLGGRRAALLYDRTAAYNTVLSSAFRDAFRRLGGTVVAEVPFDDEHRSTDFSGALDRIRPHHPDVLFSPNYYRATAAVAAQARAARLPAVVLSGEGANSPDLVRLGGDAVDGVAFPAHYAGDDPAPQAASFRRRFRDRYGRDPDALAALGYDAARLVLAARSRGAAPDPETVRAALVRVTLDGATGMLRFAGSGEPWKDVVIVRIRGTRAVFHARVRP